MSISASGEAKIALVTGGGTGVGRAMSKALGAAGYKVVISGRRTDVLEKSATELGRETGAEFFAVPADVGDPSSVRALFDTILEKYGRLDLLVNNAGV
ncbi:SDR family NAD(P)-dependent oxidoreductase, partial [Bradyrhizobium sp. Lot11]